ncbi:Ppx/GppA family phosphatase [Sphingomonas abietis]|uniref:Ppx/GppA family phosphatase n=1 Tax=Sphingomonas abietis TaxID=3012344 RepID=A0ABY7NUB2_9SPHN|nr:Ppx/GppA family phosphatase [Sphingomonas abietis]WBO24157.1 Ppx/GppA family phosphatase [Sphingomonas abietis]
MKPGFLFRAAPAQDAAAADKAGGRVGIIDIGSNSIRLVIYDGPHRIPSILFNEKVMAGLGKGLAATGALDPAAVERAFVALDRFQLVAEKIGVATLHTVATAAVRDASNGAGFLARAADMGLDVTVLSGMEEAEMAGEGVLAAFPDADGIVGDLGGGSLELARVYGGKVHERASFPLGVLRVAEIRKRGPRALRQQVEHMFGDAGWRGKCEGLPFYLVGGSWRALARLVMFMADYPLPIVHGYAMPVETAQRVVRGLAHLDKARLKEVPSLSSSRAASLPDAAALLALVGRELGATGFITSAYGLREGVLHRNLASEVRDLDPLICATREEGRRLGRFPEHGDLLDRWMAPLFADESPADNRLRHASCLLADVGWRAHPEFRGERGLETALHGNWVGIDARGRAMMAQALYTSFGADGEPEILSQLASAEDRAKALRWGLAMRLGQRLSGGVAAPLKSSAITVGDGLVTMRLGAGDGALYGEAVERRHKNLAASLGLKAQMLEG